MELFQMTGSKFVQGVAFSQAMYCRFLLLSRMCWKKSSVSKGWGDRRVGFSRQCRYLAKSPCRHLQRLSQRSHRAAGKSGGSNLIHRRLGSQRHGRYLRSVCVGLEGMWPCRPWKIEVDQQNLLFFAHLQGVQLWCRELYRWRHSPHSRGNKLATS